VSPGVGWAGGELVGAKRTVLGAGVMAVGELAVAGGVWLVVMLCWCLGRGGSFGGTCGAVWASGGGCCASAGLDAGLVVWSDSASSSNASMSMASRSREQWEKLSWLDGPEDMDTSSHSESWRVNSSVLPLMEDATEAPWCGNADVVLEMLGRAETTLWMGQLNFRS
jgi:hypothetical protein